MQFNYAFKTQKMICLILSLVIEKKVKWMLGEFLGFFFSVIQHLIKK